jgi:NitT/TauT family transport system permease protein
MTMKSSRDASLALSARAQSLVGKGKPNWRKRSDHALTSTGPVIGVLLLWELMSWIGAIDHTFFPPPSIILITMWELAVEGQIFSDLFITLQRVVAGFLLGAVPGVLLGLMMGWVRAVRLIFDPIVTIIYPIPRIAILPLFLVIFGLGSPPIIAITALICFFPAVVTTYAGVRGLDPNLPRMARNLGATRMQIMTKIAFPAALPVMFAGLRLSLGLALTGEVAAEFVAASNGIGAEIWRYWQIYRIKEMYANITVISLIGIGLSFGLLEIQKRLLSWEDQVELNQ